MILAVDVHYDDSANSGHAAGVVFILWTDATPTSTFTRTQQGVAAYEPGSFFKRELPCILPLVQHVVSAYDIETIVVDGYVDLSEGRPGLGRHLFVSLGEKIAVVGVAKSLFEGAEALPVIRGSSSKPLWVTSTGSVDQAVEHIESMTGPHRIPELLKLVDSLARGR